MSVALINAFVNEQTIKMNLNANGTILLSRDDAFISSRGDTI